ncbi:MAG: flavodoxin family protein [Muribaculaceae bacterium]
MKSINKLVIAIVLLVAGALLAGQGASCQNSKNDKTMQSEKILFINGSPNRDGNTASLAKVLLDGLQYETINLNDYRLNFYGQTLKGDQLDEVISEMKSADIIVVGSPVYWHNICASVRTLMERFYGYVPEDEFKGKKLYFIYQGAAPTKMMIDDGQYSMSRFASMYGFSYQGMATSHDEAKALNKKIRK